MKAWLPIILCTPWNVLTEKSTNKFLLKNPKNRRKSTNRKITKNRRKSTNRRKSNKLKNIQEKQFLTVKSTDQCFAYKVPMHRNSKGRNWFVHFSVRNWVVHSRVDLVSPQKFLSKSLKGFWPLIFQQKMLSKLFSEIATLLFEASIDHKRHLQPLKQNTEGWVRGEPPSQWPRNLPV